MKEIFPYKPRPRQLEVIRALGEHLKTRNVVLEAPTGFGKTPVVLSALLHFMKKGYRVIWSVRTGNETDRPIEELRIFRERLGVPVTGLSYRGKRDMCLLAEQLSGNLDYSEVSYICARERRRCRFYRKLEKVKLASFLARGALTYSEIYRSAKDAGVCPYFLQRKLLAYVNLVALSYNYVVDDNLSWSIHLSVPFQHSILVVDEAHNLQSLNLGGDTVTEGTLARAEEEARELGDKWSLLFVRHMADVVRDRYGKLSEEETATFSPLELVPEGREELVDAVFRAGEKMREIRYKRGQRPRSSLYHLARFVERALSLRDVKGVAFIVERAGGRLSLSIWDMRAAEILGDVWPRFKRVVFMSGTLTPIEAFAETIGLSEYCSIKVPSPYDESNASVYIVRDLTTKGEELGRDMAEKYVEAIKLLLARVRRNTAVFTASYRVQKGLLEAGLADEASRLGYKVFIERRDMKGTEAVEILQRFKSLAGEGRGLLVAPMGGRFAEGSDYPGEELMCVFLAGIPFEKPTTRTKLYISYYQELYGEKRGRLYAYMYPALRRAAQALGRALRSLKDQAVIVLGDYRYSRYVTLLPDYVRELAVEVHHRELNRVKPPWEICAFA